MERQISPVLANVPQSSSPCVTFMITTRNRVSELAPTLESCLAQIGVASEILVVDDASTDGTYETVRTRFPEVNIDRNEENRGSIASRNDIVRRARGDYLIALDDDSRFVEADACRRIAARMDAEPDIGIFAFQVIGPEFPATLTPEGRRTGEWPCSSFACCGAAIRRSMLEKIGPLTELYEHSYEEPDLALRAWDAGYRVVQWNEIVVYHEFSSLNRNEQRNHGRHARNEALSVVMRYPWYLVIPGLAAKLAGQARYAVQRGWLSKEPRVWWEVLQRLPRALRERRPVRGRTVLMTTRLNRSLRAAAQCDRRGGSLRQQLFPRMAPSGRAAATDEAQPVTA
jgi:GT2 family glycosyltransferase